MEKNVQISMLCQIYGKLLTDKQFELINDYYNNDLSLSEIAENNEITRQAVRDIIKRGEKKLFEYEKELKFMEKMLEQEKNIENIKQDLENIKQNLNITNKEKIEKIKLLCELFDYSRKGKEV